MDSPSSSSSDPLLSGVLSQRHDDRDISTSAAAEESRYRSSRSHPMFRRVASYHKRLRRFASSKLFHRIVLSLVVIDTLLVISQLLLDLFICEAKHPDDHDLGDVDTPSLERMKIALDAVQETSFAIGCVFVAELCLTLVAFGWKYFTEWMHIVDAFVITVGFVIDVLLKGPVEEAASLLVILRLWRIVKMAEEVVVEAMQEANEAFEELQKHVDDLEKQNKELRQQVHEHTK